MAYLTSPVASIFEYKPCVIAPEYSMNLLTVRPIPQYAVATNDPVIIGNNKTSILRIKIFTFMYNVNHDIENVYLMKFLSIAPNISLERIRINIVTPHIILSIISAIMNPIMPNSKMNTNNMPDSILKTIAIILPYEKTCGLQPRDIFGAIDKNFIRYTFSMSWLTLYMNVNILIRNMDVLLFPIITGSLVATAYWGIGLTVSRFIEYSGAMTQGLYSKILATGDVRYAINNLRYTLFVAIPMLALIIALSKPILFVLNPLYGHISIPVILFSFNIFLFIIFTFSINILRGKDEVDVDEKNNFKKYINSDLFKTSTISLVYSTSYIITLIVLLYSGIFGYTDLELITGWTATLLTFTTIFTIYTLILLNRKYSVSLPYRSMIKYTLATIPSIITINYILEKSFIYSGDIVYLVTQTLILIIIGLSIYISISVVIDKPCRELIIKCLREVNKINKFK